MTSKRAGERIGIALLVGLLAVSSLGTLGTIGTTSTAGAAGTVDGAVSDATDDGTTVASAAIGHGPAQIENGSRLTFEHTGEGRATYEVTVSGSIEAGPEADLEDAESVDTVSAGSAEGSVAEGGADDYLFTGEITSLETDGPIAVLVDGERIDPEDVEDTTTETETPTPTSTRTTSATPTRTTTGTPTPTPSPTRTNTTTATATPTETTTTTTTMTTTTTETPTRTEATTATPTETATSTETVSPSRSPVTIPDSEDGGGAAGLDERERGLFLTVGGVLLAGIVAIGGFALLVRR
jgi:hypothetical protein